MKDINNSHIFDNNFNNVSFAHWLKYPNPYNKSIIAIDILDRKILEDGKLFTKRLITTNTCVPIPNILKKYLKLNKFYIIENTIIDIKNKKMLLESFNVSHNYLLSSYEYLTYTKNNLDINKTDMNQYIKVDISNYKNLENNAINLIKNNINDGINGMNWVLNNIKNKNKIKTIL